MLLGERRHGDTKNLKKCRKLNKDTKEDQVTVEWLGSYKEIQLCPRMFDEYFVNPQKNSQLYLIKTTHYTAGGI